MKQVSLFIFLFVCPMMAFGQLKVNSIGDTYASKDIYITGKTYASGEIIIGNTLDFSQQYAPFIFKVNNSCAVFIGNYMNYNVSFGRSALGNPLLGLGNLNTAIGHGALYNNTGSNNTAVGYYAGYNNSWTNCTAIGYNATNTQSNEVVLGNSSITSAKIGVIWSTTSDGRAKKNIRADVPGLAFINRLQPVMYNFDLDALDELMKSDDPKINHFRDSLRMARSPEAKEIEENARANKEKQVYSGFIAQDVEVAARSMGYDFSGVDAPENGKGPYGLRYAEFVVPLVKAVQELSEQNKRLQEQNNRQQEQINELIAKLNELTNALKSPNAEVMDEGELVKNFTFTLFPNPTSGFVTVDYTLHVDAPICLELFNRFGQKLKVIVPQQNKKAGTYSVQISVGDLGTGTYIVKATSGSQIETKQLVVNQ